MKILSASRVIENVATLNVAVALGMLLGLWLSNLGIPYLAGLLGTIALFLPSLNLTLVIERIARKKENLTTILLWTFIFTLTVTPAATFYLGRLFAQDPVLSPLEPFAIWWALSASVLFISGHIFKTTSGFWEIRLAKKDLKEGLFLLVIFAVIMVTNFILYRFIPEADSYSYLMILDRAKQVPEVLISEPRILFLVLLNLWSKLMQIDPYWVLKIILPIGHFILPIVIYLTSRPLIKERWMRILVSLSPLFFPIILQEALISRPQSIFVLTLIPSLYFLTKLTSAKGELDRLYWIFSLFLIGILGLKIHFLFFMLAILPLIGAVIIFWPYAQKFPLYALLFTEIAGLLLLVFYFSSRLSYDLEFLARLFVQTLREGNFELWFIDSYRNISGAAVGWPGWSSLLYYGYNLGIFLPAAFLLSFYYRKKSFLKLRQLLRLWPLSIVLLFFLLIAEFLPRFQLAFLPDRAWLFVALSLSIFIPYMIALLISRARLIATIMIVAGMLSILMGWGLTYAKQGWVSADEYRAAEFIKLNTPNHAVFIGPSGLQVVINYFAKRILVTPDPQAFLGDDPNLVGQAVENERKAVYLIYSKDRFESLYTRREWWKVMNFYGAHTEKFSLLYPVIYSEGGVTIWEVRQ